MDWRDYISCDPNILSGKPAVTGTRLGAEFLLKMFASGFSEEQFFDNFPRLTPEALRAVFAFGAACVEQEASALVPAAA
jgi:uncharacterized protein (DUF433 family)